MAQKKNNIKDVINDLQGYSEQQARTLLEEEGRKLKYIAIKLWRQYLSSYKPKQYVRTRKSQRAIKLGRVERLADGSLGIRLEWENDLVYHDSVISKKEKQGHSVMLISEGWHSVKLEQKIGKRKNFTYFEGTGYISKVYEEYMNIAPKGIRLITNWSGQSTK